MAGAYHRKFSVKRGILGLRLGGSNAGVMITRSVTNVNAARPGGKLNIKLVKNRTASRTWSARRVKGWFLTYQVKKYRANAIMRIITS